MVQSFRGGGRRRYGPGSPWGRHNDSGDRSHGQASLRVLAKRYGINPKTVAKWKKQNSTSDWTSKFAFVELHEKATRRVAGDFLRALAAAVPYKIHTVLTDNGTHFTDPSGNGWMPEDIKTMQAAKARFRCHAFEAACADLDIEHRLTKPRHPWTNGQVERMNRTIKEATVKRFHYDNHGQFRQHLADFVAAYNFARRLKTLCGLTPYEAICKTWTENPSSFTLDPHHQILGPYI